MSQPGHSRRSILQKLVTGAAVAGMADFAANAQTSSRILVCVYLYGGNDGNNMVVPLDDYSSYARGRGPLALSAIDLLPATGDGSGHISFHPAMPEVRDLFDSEALAVVPNIGPSTFPISQTNNPDLAFFAPGYMASRWASVVAGATSVRGNGGVASGFANLSPQAVGATSALVLTGLGAGSQQSRLLSAATNPKVQFTRPFPQSEIGNQLLQVARVIHGAVSGISFRHFFAVHAGYDTHVNQLQQQSLRLSELSEAISAFYSATVQMGVSRQVTLYTDSDFGRTLQPNATGGSEHGWGNHQLVLGGSVFGGRVYGAFPNLALGGASDATGTGIWRPTQTKAQYLTSLAAWAGVAPAMLQTVSSDFSNLSQPGIDFLG